GCAGPLSVTRWTNSVSEWVTVTNATIALNFYPTTTNLNIVDAWIGTNFTDFSYSPTTKTITINDTNAAPSQLIINYMAYVGCAQSFDTNYPGVSGTITIPALSSNTLAGIQITADWVTDIRSKLQSVVPKYENMDVSPCNTNWVLTNILASAGYPS